MAKHPRSEFPSLLAALLVLVPGCAGEAGAAQEQPAGDAPAGAAPAPAPAAPAVSGRYLYVGGEPQRQKLFDAIEEVIADMVFLARPIARRRLRDGNLPSEELRIVVTDEKITIVRPGRPTVSAPRDGSSIVWKSPEGDEFKVRHILRSDREFAQEFVGDGNRSTNEFKLGDDGASLVVHTTITADRLPRTLRFRMSYRRSG